MTERKRIMQREQILDILRLHKPELAAKYGVTRLGIFGSVARGEATDASDVDIVVEMPPDLFQMVHMQEEIDAEIIFDICQNKLATLKQAIISIQNLL